MASLVGELANVTEQITLSPMFGTPPSTLSPGHAAIMEMHANSKSNALTYVAVVLGLYVLGMSIVVIKYIRTERYEARLTRLFHNLIQRDHIFRLSRRRSSLPKCIPGDPSTNIEDLPLSPVIQIPEIDITTTLPTPDLPETAEEESKV